MLEKGQVWEWSVNEDIHEVYVLLRHMPDLIFYWTSSGVSTEVWEALNLWTAEIELVTPEQTAGIWDLIG